MHVYKEIYFNGNKVALDRLFSKIYDVFPDKWVKPEGNTLLKNYILADYIGDLVPHAEVSIYYGADSWREGYVRVGNIVPLEKDQLSIDEYNKILDLFYEDRVKKYIEKNKDINVRGPTSDKFEPLEYISQEAMDKLSDFCDLANKATGSANPDDEKRWFDFICQTVDDKKVFDYDTLYRFLIDEEFWGTKDVLGPMGHFAWSEEMAEELAMEYDNYVRILQYYNKRRIK